MSATLTLPNQQGNYLISATAVFITLVGGCSWSILCRLAFRFQSRKLQKDGLGHQQQAILRNGVTDWNALKKFLFVGAAWRSLKTRGARRRTTIFVLLAIINIVAFITAGVLSSRIASKHPPALTGIPPAWLQLVTGQWSGQSYCGTWTFPGTFIDPVNGTYSNTTGALANVTLPNTNETQAESDQPFTEIATLLAQDIAVAQAITTCVQSGAEPSNCSPLGRDPVPYTSYCISTNQDSLFDNCINATSIPPAVGNHTESHCPFDDSMCLGEVFTLDSGFVDSYEHLGINSAKEDRIQYRNQLICAPISVAGYSTVAEGIEPSPFTLYYYGVSDNDYTTTGDVLVANLTFGAYPPEDSFYFGGGDHTLPFDIV